MSTNSNSNPLVRRLLACLVAVAVVLFQLKGSMTAIQPYLLASDVFSPAVITKNGERPGTRRTELTKDTNKVDLLPVESVHQLLITTDAPPIDRPSTNDQETHQTTPPTQQSAPKNNNKKKTKPLNVLILYPDDWRHDSIGGVAPVVHTPFLNQLAREGIRFTHNMVTTSICWVSRATLFTGQYVSRHKSYKLRTPEFYKSWHNTSWPALLQQRAQYFTGHIGKWQYSNPNSIVQTLFNYTSLFEGQHQYAHKGQVISAATKTFMEVKTFLDTRPKDQPFAVTAAFYPPKAIGNSFVPGGQWFPQNSTRQTFYENETIPRAYNETDSYARLPWFFHQFERGGRSRFKERFQSNAQYQNAMKNYYSLVTEVDAACRDIVAELERQGVLNETMVIFSTDNGLFHGEHGLAGKWYPYQESIRVPLIIRDPRMPHHKKHTLDASLTLNVDLHPTILGAAGITPPPTIQGRNMAELYLPKSDDVVDVSDEPWRTDFLYEFPLDMGKTMPSSTAVVRKDMKYIQWPQFHYEQLFNLTDDPLELNDVREDPQYANVVQELEARHLDLIEAVK